MSEKCCYCQREIHPDRPKVYMGFTVKHGDRTDCLRPLQQEIAELRRQLAEARNEIHEWEESDAAGVVFTEEIDRLTKALAKAQRSAAEAIPGKPL